MCNKYKKVISWTFICLTMWYMVLLVIVIFYVNSSLVKSCLINNDTPSSYFYTLRKEVAQGITFLTHPSVHQPVYQSCFLSSQLLSNHPTKFHETFLDNKDILCRFAYRQEITIQFFFQELPPFELIYFIVLLQQFVIATPLKLHNRIS